MRMELLLHSQLNSKTHVQNVKEERALDNVTKETKFPGLGVGRASENTHARTHAVSSELYTPIPLA